MHKTAWTRVSRGLRVGLVLGTAVVVGSCSTNLTGFDFPRFGLLKKDAEDDKNVLPPHLRGTAQRLTVQ